MTELEEVLNTEEITIEDYCVTFTYKVRGKTFVLKRLVNDRKEIEEPEMEIVKIKAIERTFKKLERVGSNGRP